MKMEEWSFAYGVAMVILGEKQFRQSEDMRKKKVEMDRSLTFYMYIYIPLRSTNCPLKVD